MREYGVSYRQPCEGKNPHRIPADLPI
jgi:hypothetical protein